MATLTDKDGLNIALASTYGDTSYVGNTWVNTVWNFPAGAQPNLIVPASSVYTTPPIDFSPWIINAGRMNGGDITLTNSYGSAEYVANTWLSSVWTFNTGVRPVLIIPASGVYPASPPIDYSAFGKTETTRDGRDITLAQAKQEVTYSSNTWVFGTVWAIIENETFPLLLQVDGSALTDPALSSRKVYVFITEDLNGSLFAEGKIWKSLKRSISFPSTTGLNGVSLTHSYGGESINDSLDEGPYVYKFSGIQDPARPGGYGSITTATERTVTYMSARSNNVAFYYGTIPAPTYAYLMRIKSVDVLFHIAIFTENVSDIRITMADGTVARVGLVAVDDEEASPIRVMTPTGIMALQYVEQPAP